MVYFVGAGPGDPGLLTQRGAAVLSRADVVLYDGLVNAVLLDLAPASAERVYVGKKHSELGPPRTQAEINALMAERAQAGRRVVRLKGGDPFVFGRAAEEIEYLAARGVPFEVVPGVSAATAVPAYAGFPLTARGVAATVAFATGHRAAEAPPVDWAAVARADTAVLFMALRTLRDCTAALIAAGRAPDTPAAAIYWGTTASQRVIASTLGALADEVAAAGWRPPVLVVVGDVVRYRDAMSWYERRPLFGARVLIPRRLEQAGAFASALAERGAQPLFAPVTRLVAPSDRGPLEKAIDRLDAYEWVVFTSANAVERWFDELASHHRDARALGLARIACVGPATARSLAARGIRADVVPAHGDAAALARAIVAVAGGELRSARVLVPRAEHGRDEAVVALRDAGAEVDVVAVYRTQTAAPDDPAIQLGLRELRAGRVDVAAFFAPSQVRALADLLGDGAADRIAACRVIAAIGPTTARAVERLGVRVDLVPSSPDAEVLARELAETYNRR